MIPLLKVNKTKHYSIFEGDIHLLKIHEPLIKACERYNAICNLSYSSVNIIIENCSPEFEAYLRSNPEELSYLNDYRPAIYRREGNCLEIA